MSDVSDRFLELDDLTDRLLGAAESVAGDPVALTFLLRRYRATGREDLTDALGAALAHAVETARAAATSDARARWLEAFVAAAALSSDPRMLTAIADLVGALRAEWRQTAHVLDLVTSIDACLQATTVFESTELVRDAIDELERVVAGAYTPGYGLANAIGDGDTSRRLPAQIRGASVLITACVGTSRLPYGMLAEELAQFARRSFWNATTGAFGDDDPSMPAADALAVNCDAVRMLCRLARLLEDGDYQRGAVVALDTDYRADASRILTSLRASARDAAAAAPYALALDEWLSLG